MEIAVVGATAVVTLDDGRGAGRPRRDHRARPDDPPRPGGRGGARRHARPTRRRVAAAARAAAAASVPISDVRASERYRRAMAEVIARRAIEIALARARGGDVPIPGERE